MRHSRVIGGVLLTVSSLLVACDRQSTDSPFSPSSVQSLSVQDIATSASTSDSQGARRDGPAPASNGGPTITAAGNQSVVNGGTLVVTIQGASPFSAIYVFVGGKTLGLSAEAAGGIGGHYEIRLASAVTSATVLLTFPQTIPLTEFEVLFAVAAPSGAVGPYVGLSTRVTAVGTGDVQVTLSWDADSDVDLHVIDPAGAEVYYAQRTSPSGGQLDLDSNAGCVIDGVRNENITWPVGRAPRGLYTVRVDYWSSCGVSGTNFTVRINNSGVAQIVTGSFTGVGDQGGLGSGRTVATFERQSGPSALGLSPASNVGSPAGVSKCGMTPPAPAKQ
jgi:uncharacterized protein YfaP (DUF2135 family)